MWEGMQKGNLSLRDASVASLVSCFSAVKLALSQSGSQRVNNTFADRRRAHWCVPTHELDAPAHPSCADVLGVKTALFEQFSFMGANRENCGP